MFFPDFSQDSKVSITIFIHTVLSQQGTWHNRSVLILQIQSIPAKFMNHRLCRASENRHHTEKSRRTWPIIVGIKVWNQIESIFTHMDFAIGRKKGSGRNFFRSITNINSCNKSKNWIKTQVFIFWQNIRNLRAFYRQHFSSLFINLYRSKSLPKVMRLSFPVPSIKPQLRNHIELIINKPSILITSR